MSSSVSQASLSTTFDSFACVECGERYSATAPELVPVGLSCGHTVCAQCASAMLLVIPPVCTVCKEVVKGEGVANPALGLLAESLSVGADSVGAVSEAAGVVSSEAAVIPEADLIELRAKAALFRTVAATAEEVSTRIAANKTQLQSNADAAVERVVATVTQLKAKLDELCAARVACIRKECDDRVKQLDVMWDELCVRSSQLRAGAVLCESGLSRSVGEAATVLGSLSTFEVLAGKALYDGRNVADMRLAADAEAVVASALESVFTALSLKTEIASEEDALSRCALMKAKCNQGETITSADFYELFAAIDVHITSEMVQYAACGALLYLGSFSPDNRPLVVAEGGLPRLLAAIEAHVGSEDVQMEACAALYWLLCYDVNKEAMVSAGVIGAVLRAMDAHRSSNGVNECSCYVLKELCSVASGRAMMLSCGAVERVRRAKVAGKDGGTGGTILAALGAK